MVLSCHRKQPADLQAQQIFGVRENPSGQEELGSFDASYNWTAVPGGGIVLDDSGSAVSNANGVAMVSATEGLVFIQDYYNNDPAGAIAFVDFTKAFD